MTCSSLQSWVRQTSLFGILRSSLILLAVLLYVAPPHSAQGATLEVLYSFCGKRKCVDGKSPYQGGGGLIVDGNGNLFGTTQGGGANCHSVNQFDCGTAFELVFDPSSAKYTEKVLYSFCGSLSCPDGQIPEGMISDGAGNFIGVTGQGGTGCQNNLGVGCGTIFQLVRHPAAGRYFEKVLYNFCAPNAGVPIVCPNGAFPATNLIMDSSKNLYGTTGAGGANGLGVVFKLVFHPASKKYTQTVLYNFCNTANCADGSEPVAGLIMDTTGNLFGTTQDGGANCQPNGCGVVFELKFNPNTKRYIEKVLYSFCNEADCADGRSPRAGVITDSAGNLFGTTSDGGTNCHGPDQTGCGTVFELVRHPKTGKYTEKVLYNFCAEASCVDGLSPADANLVMDGAGNLYGTTWSGGVNCQSNNGRGCGTIFELAFDSAQQTYTHKVLYSFCAKANCSDGANPSSSLIIDNAGNLIGMTGRGGGSANAGTIFKLVIN